jgi:hypothetical protein
MKIQEQISGVLYDSLEEIYHRHDGISESNFPKIVDQIVEIVKAQAKAAFTAGQESVDYDEQHGFTSAESSEDYINRLWQAESIPCCRKQPHSLVTLTGVNNEYKI